MDKENRELSMKTAKIMAVIAIILSFVGFAFLAICAVLQGNGVSDKIVVPTALVGFFGCNIVAIILLMKAYPTLLMSDCIKMDEFYEKQELTELCLPDREALVQRLLEHKYKPTEDGGYRRKKFSFLKDSINYHVRITEDVSIANALRREVDHLERTQIKWNNLCLILLVYMDEVGECERKEIKEIGKQYIIAETVAPKLSTSVLAIAVDSVSNMGYFMDIKKRNISFYSYGCRMIKRLFGC
ncbi:MAG: hypothetical protein K2N37_01260 [Lachnospiraceae bacterium]|nr:hypothetical protein [Lachnospiraceae bacterium]